MNEPYPFDQEWFKVFTSTEKCAWLLRDAETRAPLVADFMLHPEPSTLPKAIEHNVSFDAAHDQPTPMAISPEIKSFILQHFPSYLDAEIHLPTFRAFFNGEKTMHSVFTVVSELYAKFYNLPLQEADVVIFDETSNKRQFHYDNLSEALRWAFGSDNPLIPSSVAITNSLLPSVSLRILLLMTKKTHARSKLKFQEFLKLIEAL